MGKPRLDTAKFRAKGDEETWGFLFLKDSQSSGIHKTKKEKQNGESKTQRNINENIIRSI